MKAGSWEKICELQRRAANNEPLFQESDEPLTATIEEQEIATERVLESQKARLNKPHKNNPKKDYFRVAM